MKPQLVFVYNADSGLFNTLTDIAHKVFSPQTYACNLCAITHGTFSVREQWKAFLEGLDAGLEFLHRDDLHRRAPETAGTPLPAVFLQEGEQLVPWIDADSINGCRDMEALQALISTRLGEQE